MLWAELLRNVKYVTPNSKVKFGARVRINDVDYTLDDRIIRIRSQYNPNGVVTFYGTVASNRSSAGSFRLPSTYSVIISFRKVDVTEGLTEQEIAQGYIPKPKLTEHEVQVRCSCPSFRFRFSNEDRLNRALWGRGAPSFVNKSHRKPNNPRDLPGFCKHVIEFMNYLQSKKFVQ